MLNFAFIVNRPFACPFEKDGEKDAQKNELFVVYPSRLQENLLSESGSSSDRLIENATLHCIDQQFNAASALRLQ